MDDGFGIHTFWKFAPVAQLFSLGILERMTQRDMMRKLFRRFDGDQSRIIEAYAEAERRGEVQRVHDSRGMSADEYASRLFADGVKKSWIQED